MAALLVIGWVLNVAVTVYALDRYNALPEKVAVGFGPDGQPIIGPKTRLLTPITVMAGTWLAIALLVTAFVIFRHKILDNYPYLINLPGLTLLLGRVADKEKRREYIDRVFVALPLALLLVFGINAVVVTTILESAATFAFDSTFMFGSLTIMTGAYVAGILLYYRSIYKEVKAIVT
jgi:hypothetical protein